MITFLPVPHTWAQCCTVVYHHILPPNPKPPTTNCCTAGLSHHTFHNHNSPGCSIVTIHWLMDRSQMPHFPREGCTFPKPERRPKCTKCRKFLVRLLLRTGWEKPCTWAHLDAASMSLPGDENGARQVTVKPSTIRARWRLAGLTYSRGNLAATCAF